MDRGYLSNTGHCFDIGNAVKQALRQYKISGNPYSGSTHPATAGNGCLMRLAPVPMFFASDRDRLWHYSGESARTTHGAAECVDGSRLLGDMLFRAFSGASKTEILLGSIPQTLQSQSILTATNLGDDADTTAAICGQIAGAYYGESGIPRHWRDRFAMRDVIANLADTICQLPPATKSDCLK